MNKGHLLIGFLSSFLMSGAAMIPATVQAGALEKLFAPESKLWPHWTKHDTNSVSTIDHRQWGTFLGTYLMESADNINLVNYSGVSPDDRALLKSYIEVMQSLSISDYSRQEQFAYWVNLYNAVTVDVVLDHYPVDSIRDIKLSKGLFAKGPWSRKLLTIEGQELSLNDIEHRILRPIWQDPRIHYAVNCASIGCPNLMKVPFTAENYAQLLQVGARDYVNHKRGAQISNGQLHVSSIYTWFESDFGGSKEGVIDHLRRYAQDPLAAQLNGVRTIVDDSYDWSLNDTVQ